ncbi:hypothetical protein [Pelagicoccus albus]|uniref:Lipoprotein n=1 Tax=Pelagicoccus albus TaxID=415222 RepID=A0A7X1B825_9BACT|nr:hypothetical protein [Pelagicoccus albus]MBC2607377.1 hypothetical protein [Pelagicoccus albus]
MKIPARTVAIALGLSLLAGCAATIPVKVATKTTKAGVKTAKVGVKTTAKAGAAIIPDKKDDEAENR